MHVKSLDGLRGIAALIVVFHHTLLCFPGTLEDYKTLFSYPVGSFMFWTYLTPLRLLTSGPSMVVLFFVMSGFVLGISFVKNDNFDYFSYIIKRIFRIWFPFSVAIIVSFCFYLLLGGEVPSASYWFNDYTWNDPSTIKTLFHHLIMDGSMTTLDNPMWSLIVEMRQSFIFPFIFYLIFRFGYLSVFTFVILSFSMIFINRHVFGIHILSSIISSLSYTYMFSFGAIMSLNYEKIKSNMNNIGKKYKYLILIFSLFGMCVYPETAGANYSARNFMLLFVSSISSFALVCICFDFRVVTKLLDSRFAVWLGKISYSLYLTHVIVYAVCIRLLDNFLSYPSSVFVSFFVAIFVAVIFNKYIETPSQKIGRSLGIQIEKAREAKLASV
ncbi:peptidoglycan/LPS O-acetylase OafA/YrhL [Acetobacter aceti NBRC 14818]|uniref:Acyltransferase n=2 Tax=Acetobacter aceti TaxID=435 RepID=A0AB33IBM7_ACEAC|nr:peptidoglycan/LPS O-acetylase OafA/YrhL [Acetobacter aceti NBRC 14818]BCK75487.1 acyltransferase [Acetobacter aceti NBRC 14818]